MKSLGESIYVSVLINLVMYYIEKKPLYYQ